MYRLNFRLNRKRVKTKPNTEITDLRLISAYRDYSLHKGNYLEFRRYNHLVVKGLGEDKNEK